MIARGKNASDLFPAVVKNVACKNIEVGCASFGLCFLWFVLLLLVSRFFIFNFPRLASFCFFPSSCFRKSPVALILSQWNQFATFLPKFAWTVFFHRPSCWFQVKKLVYVYLVRYAEEQQDLALLSISTFQRGLKVRSTFLSCWQDAASVN